MIEDEFAEFDTTEAEFNTMMGESEPAKLIEPPSLDQARTAERVSAAYCESRKYDPDEWGDPVALPKPRKSENRQRSCVVSVRFNEDELATVQALAADRGQTISACLRDLATGARQTADAASNDLTITIHREDGNWWAEMDDPAYVAWDSTFDGICALLSEGLHVLGLSRERSVVTINWHSISGITTNTSGTRTITLQEKAS